MVDITYTIQMAAKISGVGVHTIRAWEKRYKAVVPKRDITGHRVYSRQDIEKLILLSELCLLGYSISKIATRSISDLKEQLKELGKTEDSLKSLEMNLYGDEEIKVDYAQSLTIILLALKAYKLDIVAQEVSKLKIVMNPREFALNLILPIMSELGSAVERGEYTVAHEHALSAILKFHLGHVLYRTNEHIEKKGQTILFCGIEEDYHEFGILIGSLLALYYKFNIYYLGPNLPIDSLVDTVKFLEADFIVVGATPVISNLGPNFLNNYMQKLISNTQLNTQVILGSQLAYNIPMEHKRRVKQFKTIEEFDAYLSKLL